MPTTEGGEGSERVKGYDIPLSFEILSEIHDADQVGQDWEGKRGWN